MVQHSFANPKPKQARSVKTEQKLLDALEKLLANKSFTDLTVAELAREAGVTTGAIYRRFVDKEDVLRSAFQRFIHDRMLMYDFVYPAELSDRELLRNYFSNLMQFTLNNVHIMRAANHLNDIEAFDHMTQARADTAEWLAGRIRSSNLQPDELRNRCRFVLRVVTATFRDTFVSGRGAVDAQNDNPAKVHPRLERLCDRLADMASSYLCLERDQS